MKLSTFLALLLLSNTVWSCKSQASDTAVYSDIEYDQEIPFYTGMPAELTAVDMSPAWEQKGQQIILTGTVFQRDGISVAPEVIVYYYHTDATGKYTHHPEVTRSLPPNKRGQTHGYIRGWVKTDAAGRYTIKTIMPGAYPSGDEPSHVHIYIKEPDVPFHYYIDAMVFDNDPLLTTVKRKSFKARGGSGIIRFVEKDQRLIGERDIILSLHIPDYPKEVLAPVVDGKLVGEEILSFTPTHAWGPDQGTSTCPICKYGWYHGILYFVGNRPAWTEIETWLLFLEEESALRKEFLKVFFIYGNSHDFSAQKREEQLSNLGQRLKLQHVALTFVPSLDDRDSHVYLNKIDSTCTNTFFIYKRSRMVDKRSNLAPNALNFQWIKSRLDASENEYFKIPRVGSTTRSEK